METLNLKPVTEEELHYFNSFHTRKVKKEDRTAWENLLTKFKESKIIRLEQEYERLLTRALPTTRGTIQPQNTNNLFDIVNIGSQIIKQYAREKIDISTNARESVIASIVTELKAVLDTETFTKVQEISTVVKTAERLLLKQLESEKTSNAATRARARAKDRAGAGAGAGAAHSYFFEGQQSLFCGKHALNNLLQKEKFFHGVETEVRAEQINLQGVCIALKKRLKKDAGVQDVHENDVIISCPGNGNYQHDVLVQALIKANYDVIAFPFHDLEKAQKLLAQLKENGLKGFLINKSGSHWVAVTYLGNTSYKYLDSLSRKRTRIFDNEKQLFDHLKSERITRLYAVVNPVIPSFAQEYSSEDYAVIKK